MDKFGDIQKLVFFGLAIGEAIDHAGQHDGRLAKAACLLEVTDEALELLTVDRQELKTEFDNFTAGDLHELAALAKDHFSLSDKDLEAKIEKSFDAAFVIIDGFHSLYALWK